MPCFDTHCQGRCTACVQPIAEFTAGARVKTCHGSLGGLQRAGYSSVVDDRLTGGALSAERIDHAIQHGGCEHRAVTVTGQTIIDLVLVIACPYLVVPASQSSVQCGNKTLLVIGRNAFSRAIR